MGEQCFNLGLSSSAVCGNSLTNRHSVAPEPRMMLAAEDKSWSLFRGPVVQEGGKYVKKKSEYSGGIARFCERTEKRLANARGKSGKPW